VPRPRDRPQAAQPARVLHWISNCKNELKDHERATAEASNGLEELYASAYALYQRRLVQANALDFDDLIMMTVHLLQAFPTCARPTGAASGTCWSTSTRTPTTPSTR
jgi:superfamily I DNA/RNA helicase